MEKTLKLGLIGAGRIGKLHAQNLKGFSNCEIKTILDVHLGPAQKLATKLSIPNVTSNPQDIFNDSEIDAVIICSSTDTHADFIEMAAKAQKQIFCEKPIALDENRIIQCLKTVKESGSTLQIGFNRRFDPSFKRVADLVKDEKIGRPHLIKISSRDPEPPPIEYVKVSGGIFMDMTIHDFDMARYLTGEEVVEIYALGSNLIDPKIKEAGDIDTAVITLKFNSGAICTIDNSRQAVYGYDQRIEVFGEKGCLSAENPRINEVQFWGRESSTTDPIPFFFLERYMESYRRELEHFIDCTLHKKPPMVGGIDGLRAAELGLAAKRSLESGKPERVNPCKI